MRNALEALRPAISVKFIVLWPKMHRQCEGGRVVRGAEPVMGVGRGTGCCRTQGEGSLGPARAKTVGMCSGHGRDLPCLYI